MIRQQPVTCGDDAKRLICELGAHFYTQGWVSGTGGGISIRHGKRIYMAPSGVLKEALEPEMIFELDDQGSVVSGPDPALGYRVSECQPLFMHAYQQRGAGAVLHAHSQWAALATMIDEQAEAFTTSHLEMQKGLSGVGYHDQHAVPIIDNTARECELADSLGAAMQAYPQAHAVLVRRHGVYVWGADWISAKRHAECYDYLFAMAVRCHSMGIPLSPSRATVI